MEFDEIKWNESSPAGRPFPQLKKFLNFFMEERRQRPRRAKQQLSSFIHERKSFVCGSLGCCGRAALFISSTIIQFKQKSLFDWLNCWNEMKEKGSPASLAPFNQLCWLMGAAQPPLLCWNSIQINFQSIFIPFQTPQRAPSAPQSKTIHSSHSQREEMELFLLLWLRSAINFNKFTNQLNCWLPLRSPIC